MIKEKEITIKLKWGFCIVVLTISLNEVNKFTEIYKKYFDVLFVYYIVQLVEFWLAIGFSWN